MACVPAGSKPVRESPGSTFTSKTPQGHVRKSVRFSPTKPGMRALTLRELEAFARPRLTGFLAFFHARIASQQTIGF